MEGQKYTVETLHRLPEKLKLENISVRELDNHIFFFSEGTPLSNFKPPVFQQKVLLFKRPDVAKEVMTATIPIVMKNLV